MANAQLVFDRNPSIAPNSFIRFNIIDNGDGTSTVYIEERTNPDANSNAASIPATGNTIAGGSAVLAQGLSKSGTTLLIDASGNPTLTMAAGATGGFAITGGAGDIVLDNNHNLRIKDSTGSPQVVLGVSTANNVTLQSSLNGTGGIIYNVRNSTGTHLWLIGAGGTEALRITATGLLTFGGTSASFPALKRSATALQVRLANDSAFAPLASADITAGAGTAITGTNTMNVFASSEATKPYLRYLSTGAGTGKWQYSNDGITPVDLGNNYASKALDNLTAVAVNTTLVSDTDNTDDLGTLLLRWKNLYTSGQILLPDGSTGAPALTFQSSVNTGFLSTSGGVIDISILGQREFQLSSQQLSLLNDNGKILIGAALDAGINRLAAGVVAAGGAAATANQWFVDAGIKRVSVQFDNNTTTLGNVTGLSVNVQAGRTYSFEATLFTTSNIGGGVKVAIGGTATATAIIYEGLTTNAGATTQGRATALGSAVGGVTAVTGALVTIYGTITVNAAGTLTVQFAENVAVGTSSVLVGSYFRVWDNP